MIVNTTTLHHFVKLVFKTKTSICLFLVGKATQELNDHGLSVSQSRKSATICNFIIIMSYPCLNVIVHLNR